MFLLFPSGVVLAVEDTYVGLSEMGPARSYDYLLCHLRS